MAAPSVDAAINAISAEFAGEGIAKNHVNEADDYKYRSIDDLLDRLASLLASIVFVSCRGCASGLSSSNRTRGSTRYSMSR